MEIIVKAGIKDLYAALEYMDHCFIYYDEYLEVVAAIEGLYNIVRIGYGLKPIEDVAKVGSRELKEVKELQERMEYSMECAQQEENYQNDREDDFVSSGHTSRNMRNLAMELGFDDDPTGLDEDDLWEQTGH